MMSKSATMTVHLSPEIDEKLSALARERKRSKSDLASEAIAAFVDVDAWQVARIQESLDEARSGAPGVLHEDVARWVESWDTEHELPQPQPKKS
jgi:predicted transcriptional regulator